MISSDGLGVVDEHRLDRRLVDVEVSTGALDQAVHVRILLPPTYEAEAGRRFPTVYLLHGGNVPGLSGADYEPGTEYVAWTRDGDAERTTADVPVIVVMPQGGGGGFYTNWYNAATADRRNGRPSTSVSSSRGSTGTCGPWPNGGEGPWSACRWVASEP